MAVIHLEKGHSLRVAESTREVRDLIVSAGAAYTPVIEVTRGTPDKGETVFVNAHQISYVAEW